MTILTSAGRLLAPALVALTLCGAAAHAQTQPSWRLVTLPDDESMGVVDANSITRQGDLATATVAVVFAKPMSLGSTTATFMVFQDRYDCAAKTEQPVSVVFYDETFNVVQKMDDLKMDAQKADGADNRSKNRAAVCEPKTLSEEIHVQSLPQLRAAWLKVMADKKDGKP
jgi:hypothetical protein